MTELGNRLKEARISKDMSLDDLQTVTKIQKRYLVGIEEGNYSMMPGPFYARAFIKQYAEAVDIEPEELFEQFKSEIPATNTEDIPEKLSRVQSRKNISNNSSKVLDILPKILVALFVIGALVLAWYFFQKNAEKDVQEPINQNNQDTTTFEESENLTTKDKSKEKEIDIVEETPNEEVPEETEELEPVVPVQEIAVVETSGRKSVFDLKNADQFELKVVSTGETWVNIKNGKGYSFFQGMLTKGGTESQTINMTKETEAVLVIGNSLSTEVYVNGQKLEYAIPPSEEVRQDITIRYVPTVQ